MTGCPKKNVRCGATLVAFVLVCLTWEVNGQKISMRKKNGFRGGAKSYEIHVEANRVGTSLHYKLPEANVKAGGKAKKYWLVDNDNADMKALNHKKIVIVSVKHPKFSVKGKWPKYKLKFKLPKDVSESGAKKMNFVRPAISEGDTFVVAKDESSGLGQSASGSGSSLNFPQNEQTKLPNSMTKEKVRGVRKIAESQDERSPREIAADDSKQQLGSADKSGFSLQKFSGLLLPLEKLKNLQLKNPAVKKEMETIVEHAKKVVNEAKTVLKDAASFVDNVKSLVHGVRNVNLNGIANYAMKAVEEAGSSELGLLREGLAIAKGSVDTATRRVPAKRAKPAEHVGQQVSQLDAGSGKIVEEVGEDSGDDAQPNEETKGAEDIDAHLNDNSQPKTAGKMRKRRESKPEREDELESFFSSVENLKNLLGFHRK